MTPPRSGSKASFLHRAGAGAALLFPRRFLRDLSLQTASSYVSTALQLARGIILARLMGPAGLGIIATVGIVIAYMSYSDLGMGRVPLREIPLAVGAGRDSEAEQWRFYGIATKTTCAALAAVGLIIYVLVAWNSMSTDMRFGLLTASLVVLATAVANEQQVLLQADQRFGRLTALVVSTSGVNLAAGIAGAVIAGVPGVFVGQLVTFAFSAVVSIWLAGLPRRFRVRRAFIRRILKAGVPFALIAFVGYNLVNIDQVMTASLLGSEALGMYTLVLYAGSALALFPNALAGAVGQRLLRRYGEEPSLDAISGLTWRPVAGLSAVMPFLCAAVWAAGPWVILWILPDYAAAVVPLRVYVVGAFFLGLNVGTSTVLMALNRHKYYIPLVAGCIGLNVALDLLFVGALHWGLIGIALGSVFTYVAYWMVHTTIIRHFFGQSVQRSIWHNLASGWPGLALALADMVARVFGILDGPAYLFGVLLVALFGAVLFFRWQRSGAWAGTRHE